MSPVTIAGEPSRPPAGDPGVPPAAAPRSLRAVRRVFAGFERDAWDALVAAAPWATPFAAWAFHRAWWDGYGANAADETLALVPEGAADDAPPVAIVPLMRRHEVEPADERLRTALRAHDGGRLTPVDPAATALFFGASYHADYATLLAAPGDLEAAAEAVAAYCAGTGAGDRAAAWGAVDLRRLRAADPAADALAAAFGAREIAAGWTLNLEREEVCPVVALAPGGTLDDHLATLGRKERHEIRRKVRRAEAVGEVLLAPSPDPLGDLDAFIDLHQARWGADGLFPPTEGGRQSRVFFRALVEHFGADGPLRLVNLTVGGRRVAAGVCFETDDAVLFYNAGVDPAARNLSPGVVMAERLVRRAIERGATRLDFLRGDEPYKYEWGAVDEPVLRLLVRGAAA